MQLTLELALGRILDGLLDLVVAGTLLDADCEVDNRDVGGGDTHRHASELAVEVGDDLADGLGGTGAAGDDVLGRATATAPVLGRGTVNGLLGGGVRVDGRHETLDDGELVVDDLGEGSQAVGGARGVGDDGRAAVVGLLVDTHHVHGGIGRGGRDDDALGTTLQVSAGLLLGGEDTGRLDDVLGAGVLPGDGSGVALRVELDALAVDDEVGAVDRHLALEVAVGRVILEHVLLEGGRAVSSDANMKLSRLGGRRSYSVVGLNEGVVDGNNLDITVLDGVAEDDATNAAEAVDANLDSHLVCRGSGEIRWEWWLGGGRSDGEEGGGREGKVFKASDDGSECRCLGASN